MAVLLLVAPTIFAAAHSREFPPCLSQHELIDLRLILESFNLLEVISWDEPIHSCQPLQTRRSTSCFLTFGQYYVSNNQTFSILPHYCISDLPPRTCDSGRPRRRRSTTSSAEKGRCSIPITKTVDSTSDVALHNVNMSIGACFLVCTFRAMVIFFRYCSNVYIMPTTPAKCC